MPLASPTSVPPSLTSTFPLKPPHPTVPNTSRPRDQRLHAAANRLALVSPFKDCLGNFGEAQKRRFNRPSDGKVNGYIKFNWPKERPSRRPSASPIVAEPTASTADVDTPQTLIQVASAPASALTSMTISPGVSSNFDLSCFLYDPAASFQRSRSLDVEVEAAEAETSTEMAPMGAPRKVPKLFGYEAQMDHTDRKFWTFCTSLLVHYDASNPFLSAPFFAARRFSDTPPTPPFPSPNCTRTVCSSPNLIIQRV